MARQGERGEPMVGMGLHPGGDHVHRLGGKRGYRAPALLEKQCRDGLTERAEDATMEPVCAATGAMLALMVRREGMLTTLRSQVEDLTNGTRE